MMMRIYTVANYKPDKKEVITYGDIISINETVTLSQHYEILSDALTELAKDESDLSRAYKGIRQELRLLSKEVQEKLPQYDKSWG